MTPDRLAEIRAYHLIREVKGLVYPGEEAETLHAMLGEVLADRDALASRLERAEAREANRDLPASTRIRRAVESLREMTVQERARIMVRAGLMTEEQARAID